MNETEITALFVRLTSSIGLLPYIAYIIVFLFHKDEYTLSFLVKFQLCMSCLVYSGSYLFPKTEVDSFFCKIQALLNTFSDLSVLATATSIVFVAQIGFSRPIELESKKRLYFILSLIFCWIVPISVSIFSILYIIFYKHFSSDIIKYLKSQLRTFSHKSRTILYKPYNISA